jgi:hypothetical protein
VRILEIVLLLLKKKLKKAGTKNIDKFPKSMLFFCTAISNGEMVLS